MFFFSANLHNCLMIHENKKLAGDTDQINQASHQSEAFRDLSKRNIEIASSI